MGLFDRFIGKTNTGGKKNMFFPGVPGTFGEKWKQGVTLPVMENNAKHLDRWHAPVQLNRLKLDLKYWRDAIAEAERPLASLPYRVMMQTVYIDTIQNGHVFACVQKRKNLTLLKEFHICDEHGNTDEEATKLLKKNWFYNGLNYILDAQFYGYSLLTFGDMVNGEFPQLTITRRWEVSPDREVLSTQPYIPTGILFNRPEEVDANGVSYFDWSLYVTTPSENGVSKCGYGLLYKVALYEIIMRSIIGWNATYTELFGQPYRWGKTNKDSEDAGRKALEEALDNMGASGWILTDTMDELEFIMGDSAGSGWKSYENLEARFEKVISSIILGHKDAITSTPGKLGAGQGEDSPVAAAINEVESTDARFVEYVVNDIWIPKLQKLGIAIPLGKRFEFKNDLEKQAIQETENINNKAVADIFNAIKLAGGEPDWNYFTERTGIPVTKAAEPMMPSFPSNIQNKLKSIYKDASKKR